MGDGQHVWAAAEWVMAARNCFVREEGGRLILGSGLPDRWLRDGAEISFGPAPTSFGTLRLSAKKQGNKLKIHWEAQWRAEPPVLDIRVPGYRPVEAPAGQQTVTLEGEPDAAS